MNKMKLSMQQDGIGMPISKISKIVGALFILSLIVPVLNWIFILSGFVPVENAFETAQNILVNEALFRFNIFNQILSALIILILAAVLYSILKTQSRRLSLMAFAIRSIEVFLSIVIAFLHLVLLLAIKGQNSFGLNKQSLEAIAQLLITEHIQLTFIPGVFFGLGMLIFAYLMFKVKLVPDNLSIFGIISYSLICIYDTTNLLFPEYQEIAIFRIVCTTPVCIFHIAVGVFLLLKGFQVSKQ